MTKRLTIGFDVDGVLAAFSPTFINIANGLFDLNLKPEDQTGWAHQSLGLSDEQADEVWDVINTTPNWWESLSRLPNTSALTEAAQRHKIFFITHRNPTIVGRTIEDQTANWLRKNFFILNPLVITCEKKGLVAQGLELDAFIDDKPANTQDVIKHISPLKVFLQDAPYNKDFNMVRRVMNVNQFISIIGGDFGGSIAIAA